MSGAPLAGVPVMVLAAGLGTRLRPLTDELPKPAVPVANRSLVAFTLDHVARNGGRRVVMNSHHLADRLEEAARASAGPELALDVLREEPLLGTGGGVRNARDLLFADGGGEVVVLNADILFAPDLAGALATHRRLGAVATMVVRPDPDAVRYGAVEVDASSRVRRLLGAPAGDHGALRMFMFTGVHVLSRAAFDDLPEQGCVVRHAYRRWVDEGAVVAAHADESPWRDLGTIPAYLEANLDLASGRLRWPGVAAAPDGNLVEPTATIGEGATLRGVVIGDHAIVDPHVTLERCVLWPHARASAPAADTVLTTGPGPVVSTDLAH
jgi:mannose-1-phosphate guanylyltransferase